MFKILTKTTTTIGISAGIISIFTIVSQILAVIRNKIFATEFGASNTLDIYNTAFKIPDMIFLLVGMMVSGSILIPLLAQKEKKSKEEYQNFISKIFFTFSVLLIFISTVIFFLMPFLINFIFSGFQGADQIKLIELSRIMLLSPIFMGIANIFISINQKNFSFIPVAITGIFYNIAIIFSIYFFYPLFGINGIVYGVILGSVFYFLLQLPSIFQHKLFPKKISFLQKKEFFDFLKISLPRSLALFIAALIPVFLYSQASQMPAGSITMLQFALSLYFVPITVITVSYSLATFPILAKFFVEKKNIDFSNTVSNIISRILFFSTPISLFFIFFSAEIIGFLFGSLKFNIDNINITALIFSVFSLIIIIHSLNIMFSRILYAIGNTYITMYSNLIALFSIIIFFLIGQMFFTVSLLFLAIIFFLSFLVSFIFLFLITKIKVKNYLKLKNLFLIKKITISIIAILVTRIIMGWPDFETQKRFFDYFQILLVSGLIFVISFIILSEIFQEKNYLDFKRKILKLF